MPSTTPNNIAFPSRFNNQMLTDEQLGTLKNGTLQLLDEVGVHLPSQRALELFSDHGARVDMNRQNANICTISPLAHDSNGIESANYT